MEQPDFKDIVVVVAVAQLARAADAPAYKGFKDLPAIMDTCKQTTVLGGTSEYDVAPGNNQCVSAFPAASVLAVT